MTEPIYKEENIHNTFDADVVITHPTNYAVALKYDGEQTDAPSVVDKGIYNQSRKIEELSNTNCIP